MFNMGFGELMLVLLIVVIVFGSARLPPLGERLRVQARAVPREAARRDDWLFITTMALLLSFALAVAMVISSGHR